ncbi:MAG: Re/Si-specific NAD(P)(+) transhydrogenase subunit alpha [Alphaproteobacteria bacterium]|nr:Re/Si-specific NAD(P)(+) transhydrogenase subunit alpha [Alphaproteobacteria bacterium]
MQLTVLKERRPYETRVAATPETVKKLIVLGFQVVVEKGAGESSHYVDTAYEEAGATIESTPKKALEKANVVLKVGPPMTIEDGGEDEASQLPEGALLLGILQPYAKQSLLEVYNKRKVTAFSLELAPRITRAQALDVLSSQSNLAGYRAVIEAANSFERAFPMMMTAAGTIAPARVLILGAGVAGLQAVATAKRLGAIVSVFDVRAVAKEQVESLGGTFVEVESQEAGEAAGGYAKEMSDDYKARQAAKIKEVLQKSDIAITTALIPGKPAPRLLTADMVKAMKPGSVIVDLAVESGGNCEGSVVGKIVETNGVKIIGYANMPGRIPTDASAVYARNLLNLLTLCVDKESKSLKINWEDEIIQAIALTHDGKTLQSEKGTN